MVVVAFDISVVAINILFDTIITITITITSIVNAIASVSVCTITLRSVIKLI